MTSGNLSSQNSHPKSPSKEPGQNPVLVLSGGAARGAGHLGFLAAMDEAGVVPKAIVGTSAGALIGGLYASWNCTTKNTRDRLETLTYGSILRLAFSRRGIFSSRHLEGVIRSSLGKEKFCELPVPLKVVVTNLSTRSLDILDSGELSGALAASCALPPLFVPFLREGTPYIDGGVLSIVPVLAARRLYPRDTIIAVNVNASSPSGRSHSRTAFPSGENLFSLSLRYLMLALARASYIEGSFADHVVLIPGGDYPLFGLRSIERIYELGYTEGKEFFARTYLAGSAMDIRNGTCPGPPAQL